MMALTYAHMMATVHSHDVLERVVGKVKAHTYIQLEVVLVAVLAMIQGYIQLKVVLVVVLAVVQRHVQQMLCLLRC